MRKLLLGTAMTLVMAGYAAAADLPVYTKAPPPPMWSWTGFYIGGNFGYSVGRDPTDQTLSAPGGGLTSVLVTSDKLSPAGVLGGGQIGYNWQISHTWLFGVEADFQWTDQHDSSCSLVCGDEALNVSQRLDWFGTARARLGYIWSDSLWYVTGGGAWGRIDSSYSLVTAPPIGTAVLGALSTSTTRGGWVFGGGVETHLWGGWTGRLEYLYMDLGGITDTYALTGVATTVTVNSSIRDHIFRTALNYKF